MASSPSKSVRMRPGSPSKAISPEKKKGKGWDSLWSLDLSLEGGKGRK